MPNPQNIERHKFTSENQPANRGRKPGSRNVSTVLREMLEKLAPGELIDAKFVKEFCKGKKRVTSADAAAARIMFEALVKGEPWALRELMDRTEGKASQPITGRDGGPIEVRKFVVEVLDGDGGSDNHTDEQDT